MSKTVKMRFDLKATDTSTQARAAIITTDHGKIETPIFMPVGTVGYRKGSSPKRVKTGYQS